MADKGTAVLIAVAIGVSLALVDLGATSAPSTPSATATERATANSVVVVTSDSTATSAPPETARAPAPLASCPGRLVGEQTANNLTVRVTYDSQSGGLNCVTAVYGGVVTPPGYLLTEIRIADYTGTSWPRYASKAGDAGAAEVSGAYLVQTDGKCVTGSSTYYPSGAGGGSTLSVSLSGIGCR